MVEQKKTLKSRFICLVTGHGALDPNTKDLEEEIKEKFAKKKGILKVEKVKT